ncbi:MAG: methionyl-tRNA formyltransferase [Phycisphaerae bacterium]|nr:methionyl-tRNA formyltransferase [Phycisphaerae bacterium]
MKIVFLGSSSFGLPSLEAIADSRHTLAGVFTQPARPAGRHRKPKPTDVADWCAAKNIPCTEADNINTHQMRDKVAACGGDLLVVIAFGQKIAQPVIDLFRFGAINVHASLLPRYRGAAPIHWAMMRGESETGVSIITLAQRMDAGAVLAHKRLPIELDDTFQTLHHKLAALSAPVLLKTIEAIEAGQAEYTQQDETLVTQAPRLTKEHGYIDWNRPAEEIANQVRALCPWPGAQSVYVSAQTGRSWRVTICRAQVIDQQNDIADIPGVLDDHFNVICGWNRLKILEVKPAGSDTMSFEAFARGRNTRKGDLFLPIDRVLQGIGL